MAITKETSFDGQSDRYGFDFGLTPDFAQLDTSEDASYYGNWASPLHRKLVSYTEGDICITSCDTDEEFVQEINEFVAFCERIGYKFKGIDPGLRPENKQRWIDLGLKSLLH